jgi:hypothetical protein
MIREGQQPKEVNDLEIIDQRRVSDVRRPVVR